MGEKLIPLFRPGPVWPLLPLLLLAPTPGMPSHANEAAAFDHERAWHLQRMGKILPLEEILRRAQQHRPGRILEVALEEKDERVIYELELADGDDQVWELLYDAQNGALLKEKRED